MDPRLRIDSISSDILRRIALSCDDHWSWLAESTTTALKKKDGNARAIPIQNVLKSPVRKAAAKPSTASSSIWKDNNNNHDLQSSSLSSAVAPNAARANAVFANPPLLPVEQRNSASSLILRSPGKNNLQYTLAQLSPSSATTSTTQNNNIDKSRAISSTASKMVNTVAEGNKENSNSIPKSPVKADYVKPTSAGLATSLRSPQVRNILTSSTSSRQYQHNTNSPSTNIPLSPRNATRNAMQASPTPRPVSRIAVPRMNSKADENNNTPQKVVDDVFLSGTARNTDKEAEPEEEEEEEEDDEEVADILLGYTKTPATARKGNNVQDTSVNHLASPGMGTAADADGKPSNKLLPPLPISKPTLNTQTNLPLSKISPPRPLRSPSRPSPTPPKHPQHTKATSSKPAGGNGSVIHSRLAMLGGGSPVKRDMSNLESIASVLNSPSKPSASSAIPQTQTSRPGSPTSSRVPVPRPGSPTFPASSAAGLASTHTSPKTSRLRSPILQAVKSLSPPPLRSSSRLASSARPGSPLQSTSTSTSAVNSPAASPKMTSPATMSRPQSPLRSPRLQLKKSKVAMVDAPAAAKDIAAEKNVPALASSSIPTAVDSPARTAPPAMERPTSPPLLRSPRLAAQNRTTGSPSGIARPTSPVPSSSTAAANTGSIKSPLRHQLSKTLLPSKKKEKEVVPAQEEVQVQQKSAVFPMMNEVKSPVKKSVREEIEARLLAKNGSKSPVKAAIAPPAPAPVQAPAADVVKDKEQEKEKKNKVIVPSQEDHAVKAKDFVDAPSAPSQADVQVEHKDAALASAPTSAPASVPQPIPAPSSTLPESIPKKAAPRTLSTAHLHNINTNANAANIPPSPVFSSFLSQNPARPSALSFIGLQNRILGGGNASNNAPNTTNASGAGGREKSLGLGLGLSGLNKSLGNGLHAQQSATQMNKEDQDSQGTTASSASSQQTSFFSATSVPSTSAVFPSTQQAQTSSKKRLSSTFDSGTESSQANKQPRIDGRTSIVSGASQADDTKQRLDLLRSRISNIKSSNRTSSAATTLQNRTSIAHSTAATTNRASIAVQPAAAASSTAVAEALFSPPLPSAGVQKPHSTTAAPAATSVPAQQPAASASSAFASAVAAFVPAPSFGSSFVSLFSSSLAPSALSASTANHAKDTQKNEQHTSPIASKAQTGPLYPALPSATNLAATLSPTKAEGKNLLVRKNTVNTEDGEEEEEVLQDERTSPVQPKKPALVRASSGSSVHDMIKNFEAKATTASLEKEREATLSPIKSKAPMFVKPDAPARPTLQAPTQAMRSTTPPFSPPKQVTVDQHAQASASGELELDIEDLAVEPIARASSQDISDDEADTAEADGSDADMEDGEVSEAEEDTAPQAQQEKAATKPALAVPQQKQQERAKSATPFFDAQESDMDDQPEYQTQSQPVRSMNAPNKPSIAVLPASQPSTKTAFKPKRPTAENASVVTKQHRPPSRAPSVTSLAPSRASTISINSASSAPLGKSTIATKKGPLAASTSGKPEVKSLQLAAAAAKKEQLDKERKAVLKEDRDNKRAAETEKDKKRKDRDELAQSTSTMNLKGKAPAVKPKIAITNKATEDEPVKKRKVEGIEVVIPAKPAVKKTTVVRTAQTTTSKTVSSTLSASTSRPANLAASSQSKALAASASAIGHVKQASATTVTASSKTALYTSKAGSSKPGPSNALLSQHQQAILQASTSLAKSQASSSARPHAPPPKVASEPEPEPFELPEVDSEYSDSDEETQAKKAALRPDWTQSPELRQALAHQANFNPDELFGAIPQLQMEEMFKNKSTAARLRPRTSSMHWTGTDALTAYEEQEYARRMGFRSTFFTGSSQQQ